MRIALIPGSFDPITLGHVNIVERAAKMFDKVYVAVMINDSAKYDKSLSSKQYLFTMEERLEMARLSVAHIENAEAISAGGMLIDLCDELDVTCIVKGIRNAADLEYEMIHARWNKAHNDRAETMFLPAAEDLTSVSSTVVRQMLAEKKYDALRDVIHPDVLRFLKNR
jgi:pantetheine-phosphate adenylyltransferase